MDIVDKPIGSEGSLDLQFKDGKLVFLVKHNHASGSVSLVVEEDAGYFLDKLAAVIPGQVDDAIFAVLKGALKTL